MTPFKPIRAADEFRLSITQALSTQLTESMRSLSPAPLDVESLGQVADRQGIYELFLNRQRVYVGKASTSMAQRLNNHRRKLSGRTNIAPGDVTFVCLYVEEDLEAAAPESLLIKKYRAEGEATPWNKNGFGNKDPGRRRDTSRVKEDHFDATYPIDLDAIAVFTPGGKSIKNLLAEAKSKLPYLLRYEMDKHQRDFDVMVEVDSAFLSLREVARGILAALPVGWQLTALPGYTILYKEAVEYDSALMWWRSAGGAATDTRGPARLEPAAVGVSVGDEVEGTTEDPPEDDDT